MLSSLYFSENFGYGAPLSIDLSTVLSASLLFEDLIMFLFKILLSLFNEN